MKIACEKWKDQLVEAALTETTAKDFEEHLLSCANCSAELDGLRARKSQLDALLPLVARGAEPSADFQSRVLAAAGNTSEGNRARPWRVWTLAGATAVIHPGGSLRDEEVRKAADEHGMAMVVCGIRHFKH